MRICWFQKRQDACSFLRVQTPMSHLSLFKGHETREVLVEQVVVCSHCRHQEMQEIQTTHIGDNYCCEKCFTPLMSGLNEWKKSVYEMIDWCDVAVFQRNTDLSHLMLMKEAKRRGKFIVSESDDNYFAIPEKNPGYSYYQKRLPFVKEMLELSDGLTVTTNELKAAYSVFNKNIMVIRNAYDLDVFDATPGFPDANIFRKDNSRISLETFDNERKGKKFVCWAGSPSHQEDLEMVIQPIKKMLDCNKDSIMGMVTYVAAQMIKQYPYDQFYMFGLVPVLSWFSMLKTLSPDIYIAPVVDNLFNQSKSELKLIEAAMMGAIPVVSNHITYNRADFTAFHVDDNKWGWNLQRALNVSIDEKEEIVSHNKQILREQYDIKVTVDLWDEFFTTGVARES